MVIIVYFVLDPHSLCSPTHNTTNTWIPPTLFQCCALSKKFVKYKSIFTSLKFGCRFLIFRMMDGSYPVGQDRKKEHLKDMFAQVLSHPLHGNLIFFPSSLELPKEYLHPFRFIYMYMSRKAPTNAFRAELGSYTLINFQRDVQGSVQRDYTALHK